jgi:arabinoxylan arabinofuranohydrolase
LKVAATGSWSTYKSESTNVSGATGLHNFYLVFVGKTGVANVKSFSFSTGASTTTPPPSSTPTARPAKTTIFIATQFTADKGIVGDHYSGIGSNGGNWAEYANIDFGSGVTKFKANIAALSKYAGSIQLRLDSPTGKIVGTLKVAGTGAWNKYVQQSASVSGVVGIHNLYLVFVGGGGTGNVESFTFA